MVKVAHMNHQGTQLLMVANMKHPGTQMVVVVAGLLTCPDCVPVIEHLDTQLAMVPFRNTQERSLSIRQRIHMEKFIYYS